MSQLQDSATVVPTRHFQIFDKKVDVYLFGRGDDDFNWSLGTNYDEASQRIAAFASLQGVSTILAPRADFSGRVRERREMEVEPKEVMVDGAKVTIKRGSALKDDGADGCTIYTQEAFYVASGDCPTAVLHQPRRPRLLVCSHAGRDCLWHREAILNGRKSRAVESVVDAMARQLQYTVSDAHVFITCGIDGKDFIHSPSDPAYGDTNTKMIEHFSSTCGPACASLETGEIHPKMIIEQQFIRRRVPVGNIMHDDINTFSDTDGNGKHVWWSCRRGDKERNGVLIVLRE